jgi:hypothetical protein
LASSNIEESRKDVRKAKRMAGGQECRLTNGCTDRQMYKYTYYHTEKRCADTQKNRQTVLNCKQTDENTDRQNRQTKKDKQTYRPIDCQYVC